MRAATPTSRELGAGTTNADGKAPSPCAGAPARGLLICCWKWGAKYPASHVNKLAAGVARHYCGAHRFLCITDDPTGVGCETVPLPDPELTKIDDGCYARLRTFDPAWQQQLGASRIIWLDLDAVCVGDLGPVFDRPEPLVLLAKSHFNPCPVNGSILSVAAGARPDIWQAFDIHEARRIANADGHWRGSDQTWLAAKAPDAALWSYRDGVYAWKKPGWPVGDALPAAARLVVVPGAKDPAQLTHLGWIREHWRE